MDSAQPKGIRGSLLVVDDDLSALQTMDAFLSREGYEVRCAPNGETALMFAHEDPPELILLDIRLPDMDGFQVCRRLKEGQKTSDIPTIFISALDEVVDKVKGFAAGAVDYITKPFQAEEVLARVETHLSLRRLQKQVEVQNAQLQQEIIERKQAQEALQRAHDELEMRVKERTADLATANEQLVASEKALEERLRFETLLAEISAHFVNLPVDQIDSKVIEAQRRVCEIFDIDRSTVWQTSEREPDRMLLTDIHQPPGSWPNPERMDARDSFPWSMQKVLRGEILPISKMADLPSEATRDRETWCSYGTKSTLLIPLSVGGGKVFGALSFAVMREERDWPEPIVKQLLLVSELFANALARKRADVALHEAEERLSLSAESAEIALWGMDVRTGHIWGTIKGLDLLGLAPGAHLTNESFYNIVHPDDRERVRQVMQEAVRSRKDSRIEYRIIARDGSVRWRISRSRPHFTSNGEVDRMMGASIDITERKRMEEQLEERLRQIEELKQRLEGENIYLHEEVQLLGEHSEIVGQSLAMKKVLAQVEQVAQTDSTVLILGETGTGKELVARAIHGMSGRKARLLVTVNCASLPPTLIESELFGREKGAYTGALTKMIGRFEIADGATLFLDEIGEIPLELQSKLLRVLEEGNFERLGSTKTLHVDVRIITATNRDIAQEVQEGRFRKDLFYRLNVFPIVIPPLRERPEDIPLLVWAFVKEFQKKMGKKIENISKKSMEALQSYSWPGNVRELRNVIEHAMIVSSDKTLVVHAPKPPSSETPAVRNLEDMERRHIVSVLEKNGWRVGGRGGAAEVLGLKRSTLYSRMKKLGINRPNS